MFTKGVMSVMTAPRQLRGTAGSAMTRAAPWKGSSQLRERISSLQSAGHSLGCGLDGATALRHSMDFRLFQGIPASMAL